MHLTDKRIVASRDEAKPYEMRVLGRTGLSSAE